MNNNFATRMGTVHESFLREILKVTQDPEIISFAGGLPNPQFFPVEALTDAATKVMVEDGRRALQYNTTEGHYPLREFIAKRYAERRGLQIDPDEILITNGSQQGLDLIAKIFLDKGDHIAMERPGYLGAIQAFSLFEPVMHSVPLQEDGIDLDALSETFTQNRVKLFYAIPNFQNPSGISYSASKRQAVAELLKDHQVTLVEDDPYGELRFTGEDLPPIRTYAGEQAILLGSFSKIVSPGLRMGWVCAPRPIMDKLVVAKQAADLHSNFLSQRILGQYLLDNDLDAHIAEIKAVYKKQRDLMLSSIQEHFPQEVSCTQPEGGMFVWITLPKDLSSTDLFHEAAKSKVAFVPGKAFHLNGDGHNTFRLNFSNADEDRIVEGVRRLGVTLEEALAKTRYAQ